MDWNSKDDVRAYHRRWYAANRERRIASSTRWASENAEKKSEYQRRYYRENREKLLAAQREYRADNRELIRERDRSRSRARTAKRSEALLKFRAERGPCSDCGERDPIVLEFDHDHPSQKVACVSELWYAGRREAARAEADKCTVRCANCHRRKTVHLRQTGPRRRDGAHTR